MHEHSIDGALAGFIRIKYFEEKMAEEASALRNATCVNAFSRRQLVLLLLQVGSKIAYRREPKSGHNRVADTIDDLVDFPGLEPAI